MNDSADRRVACARLVADLEGEFFKGRRKKPQGAEEDFGITCV